MTESLQPEPERIAEIVYFDDALNKRKKTPDQMEYFRSQAAQSEIIIEDLQERLEHEIGKRAYYLSLIGMLPERGGYDA